MFGRFGGRERLGGDGQNTLPDGRKIHLALYKFDRCPYCRYVFRAIDQRHVAIEYRDIRQERRHLDALVMVTGRRTVPCLFIDGRPMFESEDIIAWLEATFPLGTST